MGKLINVTLVPCNSFLSISLIISPGWVYVLVLNKFEIEAFIRLLDFAKNIFIVKAFEMSSQV